MDHRVIHRQWYITILWKHLDTTVSMHSRRRFMGIPRRITNNLEYQLLCFCQKPFSATVHLHTSRCWCYICFGPLLSQMNDCIAWLVCIIYCLIVQEILSWITAWSPMVGTPIDQVRRLINQGQIKDLISPLLSVALWNDERAVGQSTACFYKVGAFRTEDKLCLTVLGIMD